MNMFRNLLTAALFIFGMALVFGKPESWTWINACGPYVVHATRFCIEFKPFVVIMCIVLSMALFMTRKQY